MVSRKHLGLGAKDWICIYNRRGSERAMQTTISISR